MDLKIKIIIVVNDLFYFVSHRLPIALAAKEKGYEMHVAYGNLGGVNPETLVALGLKLHYVPIRRGGANPLLELRSVWNLWLLFTRLKPNLVHLVTIKPVLYGGIAARISGVPAVVSAIAGLGFVFTGGVGAKLMLLRTLLKLAFRLALGHPRQILIFQNQDDSKIVCGFVGVASQQTRLIRGSGVDLTHCSYFPEPDGLPIVAMAARLLRDKGVLEFVEAAKILKMRRVEALFWLIGEPDISNPTSLTLEELSAIKTEGVVHCLGYQNEVPSLYAKANIVALPSYREGLPKSLMEAAACGRAVVTTDVPGCRDAIESGITGLVVPPRNAIALADALEDLICDDVMRHTMGKLGRHLAEREFGIDKVVDAHLQIYSELLESSES
jgi:glycosyltransferase involved in cell wall biosynthesis